MPIISHMSSISLLAQFFHLASTVTLTALDIFCGAGGMSLGFKQAGINVLGAVDYDAIHLRAYKRNFPDIETHQSDLADWKCGDAVPCLAARYAGVDVVFGGPPCQGFSVGGRRGLDDPRNELLMAFSKLVSLIRPRYFVVENVTGLLYAHARSILDSFISSIESHGYSVVTPIQVLDAQDFGVPQRRKRVFILGFRHGLSALKYPDADEFMAGTGHVASPTVRDAIEDLFLVDSNGMLLRGDRYCGPLGTASEYTRRLPVRPPGPYDIEHSSSDYCGSSLGGCSRSNHDDSVRRRFASTEPGQRERVSRFFRLSFSGVAPTLRAGTDLTHGRYTAPRPIHPVVDRCITVREAARLHSLPDWFELDSTIWHGYRQIGNAVPPLLAEAVARSVAASSVVDSSEVRSGIFSE